MKEQKEKEREGDGEEEGAVGRERPCVGDQEEAASSEICSGTVLAVATILDMNQRMEDLFSASSFL